MMTTAETDIQKAKRKLPDGWQLIRLGKVCEENAATRDPHSMPDKRFCYVDITSVDNTLKRITAPKTLIGRDAPSRARQVIRTGDVIVSATRPNLNAVAQVPSDLDDQICSTGFCVLRAKPDLDPNYLFAFVRTTEFVQSLSDLVKGALYPAVTDKQVRSQLIPFPPLPEQKRLAAILNEQMAAVERARAATETQLEAAKALPAAYLRTVFINNKAQQWRMKRLGEVCEIQLGKMLSPASKVGVRLRPYLRNANVQWGRVDLTDVAQMDFNEEEESKFSLKTGDLLVCEGGEPGRAAVWDGRISPCYYQKALHRLRSIDEAIDPYFILYRLWMGALQREFFGSHAKTTIAHLPAIRLHELPIRIPALSEQRRISARLSEQMVAVEQTCKLLEEQLATINALPASLLRRAFSGELTQQRAVKAQPKLPKGIFFKRAAIASYIINRLYKQSTFGRVQFEKVLYLTEAHVGIDLAGRYKREAAGPLDSDFLYKLESLAGKQRWFTKRQRGAEGFFYRPGPSISGRLGAAETILGDRRKEMDRLLDLFEDMDTEQAEVLSTLFAAWNDFLQDGLQPTDEQIIQEVRERWHSAKERFTTNQLQAVLNWMREHKITPRGIGPRTEVTNGQT